jgi:hypothetical protein
MIEIILVLNAIIYIINGGSYAAKDVQSFNNNSLDSPGESGRIWGAGEARRG